MAQQLCLEAALEKPLFGGDTEFIRTSPSTKTLPAFFTPFAPRPAEVQATAHPFFEAYGNSTIPKDLPGQTSSHYTSKTNVKAACDIQMVQWIATCLRDIGSRRTDINVLRGSQGIPRVFTPHQHIIPDIRVDFAFIHGQSIGGDRVAAVLQTKAVGSLDPLVWRGAGAAPADRRMTQEARA